MVMNFPKINTLFYGIPKNASESISTTITKSLQISRNHNHTTRNIDINTNKFIFSVIRDPIKRFYSAYTFLQYQKRWQIPVNKVLDLLEKFPDLAEKTCRSRNNGLDIVFIKQIKYCKPNMTYILFDNLDKFWKIPRIFKRQV